MSTYTLIILSCARVLVLQFCSVGIKDIKSLYCMSPQRSQFPLTINVGLCMLTVWKMHAAST